MPRALTTAAERRSRESRLEKAIEEWHRDGQTRFASQNACAAAHDIHPSLFSRRLRMVSQSPWKAQEQNSLLPDPARSALTAHLVYMANRGYPATNETVLSTARDLLTKLGRSTSIGKQWSHRFVRDNPRLHAKYKRPFQAPRGARNQGPEVIPNWFDLLKETVETYNITQSNTYNVDETGFMTGDVSHSENVIVEQSQKKAERLSTSLMTQPGEREWVTAIQAISATGQRVDPLIIIKGSYVTSSFNFNLKAAFKDIADAKVASSVNGWSDSSIAVQWLRSFAIKTAPMQDDNGVVPYRLLILDDHPSHASIDFVTMADHNRVILLCLPTYSTHLLQPLEVDCFKPLKRAYGELVANNVTNDRLDRDEFIHLYASAWQQVLTPTLIRSSFESTGIWPFDPDRVLDQPQARPNTPPPRPPPRRSTAASGPPAPGAAVKMLLAAAELFKQQEQLYLSQIEALKEENARLRSDSS